MIAKVEAKFQVPAQTLMDLQPSEEVTVNLPLGLQGLLIPHAGAYAFDMLIDNTHTASVPFHAVVMQAGHLPPQSPGTLLTS